MGVKVTIVGVGAFIPTVGDSRHRLIDNGKTVEVDDALAKQLIADRVAVKAGGRKKAKPVEGEPEPQPDTRDEQLLAAAVEQGLSDDVVERARGRLEEDPDVTVDQVLADLDDDGGPGGDGEVPATPKPKPKTRRRTS